MRGYIFVLTSDIHRHVPFVSLDQFKPNLDGTLLGASHIKIILDILYAKWVTIAENAKMS
jgi:hypothetical protein